MPATSSELNGYNQVHDQTLLSMQNVAWLLPEVFSKNQGYGVDSTRASSYVGQQQGGLLETIVIDPASDNEALTDEIIKFVGIDENQVREYSDRASFALCSSSIKDGIEVGGSGHWTSLHLRKVNKDDHIEIQAFYADSLGNQANTDDLSGIKAFNGVISKITQDQYQLSSNQERSDVHSRGLKKIKSKNVVFKDISKVQCMQQNDNYSCGYHTARNLLVFHKMRNDELSGADLSKDNSHSTSFDKFLEEYKSLLQKEFNFSENALGVISGSCTEDLSKRATDSEEFYLGQAIEIIKSEEPAQTKIKNFSMFVDKIKDNEIPKDDKQDIIRCMKTARYMAIDDLKESDKSQGNSIKGLGDYYEILKQGGLAEALVKIENFCNQADMPLTVLKGPSVGMGDTPVSVNESVHAYASRSSSASSVVSDDGGTEFEVVDGEIGGSGSVQEKELVEDLNEGPESLIRRFEVQPRREDSLISRLRGLQGSSTPSTRSSSIMPPPEFPYPAESDLDGVEDYDTGLKPFIIEVVNKQSSGPTPDPSIVNISGVYKISKTGPAKIHVANYIERKDRSIESVDRASGNLTQEIIQKKATEVITNSLAKINRNSIQVTNFEAELFVAIIQDLATEHLKSNDDFGAKVGFGQWNSDGKIETKLVQRLKECRDGDKESMIKKFKLLSTAIQKESFEYFATREDLQYKDRKDLGARSYRVCQLLPENFKLTPSSSRER